MVFLFSGRGTIGTNSGSLSIFDTHRNDGLLLQTPSEDTVSSSSLVPQDRTDSGFVKVDRLDELKSIYEEDFREDQTTPESGKQVEDAVDDNLSEAVEDENRSAPEADGEDEDYSPLPDTIDYHEIFSLTRADRKYIPIFTNGVGIYNPNIIPHPTEHDMWIVVAQHEQSAEHISVSEQVACNVGLLDGVMVCAKEPSVLPIEPSIDGQCPGDLAYYNFRRGPRDARMFYGPDAPYILYGSQSAYTCLGIWLEDVRMLLQDFHLEQTTVKLFDHATEVQRPPPVRGIEKNFFLFWDSQGKAYAHHDIFPRRAFAQISFDGSVGLDLAPLSYNNDNVCLAMYLPALGPSEESIHQASNSLSITFCKRKDPGCAPDASNTFLFTIFQHKSYHDYHGIYEPYIMVFQRDPPFAIHAISQRPLWIHGRATLTKETHSLLYDNDSDRPIPEGHTEMFYVTSISWKTHGQRFHGYLDDTLFLGFGIEDSRAGLIDVLAEDLFQDLGYCA
ncbi:hypothetical protein D6D19_10440 [Aureobasidium pullulans]|uniref:Uncharacterized protein n=1 Tax=Aureobasidium pullulans TaxID=5580 RepID=A0A4S8YZ02_AURPU|nr:hypothetical protein D6D19_10440 [Aureobasidium pullulans]